MHQNRSQITRTIQVIVLVFCQLLMGCAPTTAIISPEIPPVKLTTANSMNATGWHKVRFQIAWQPGAEPDWYIDTMLAGEVIAPILAEELGKQLILWRFHRRAGNDATGHAFSFLFYSQTRQAEQIHTTIKHNAFLAQWQREGRIKQIHFDDLNNNTQPNIEDSSDKSWPLAIQKSWPKFIMGACQMWLDLIAQLQTNVAKDQPVERRYQEIQKQINQLWESNGQHAWLHQLNAVFNYHPIAISY